MTIETDYADLKIEKIRLEQELEDTNAELDLYKRALEWVGMQDYYLELARRDIERERLKGYTE